MSAFILQWFIKGARVKKRLLFTPRPGLVALWNNFLFCVSELTVNVHVVEGGSEDDVES